MKYKHIFFDLDRTLWDFERNATETLREIFSKYKLHLLFESFDSFLHIYKQINDNLWALYRENKLTKEILRYKRFSDTLKVVGYEDEELARKIGDDYVYNGPKQKNLFPGAHEILNYLVDKKYNLYIITNGFKEVQRVKLENTGLIKYFKDIFISEEIGFQKPNPEIFRFVLSKINAKPAECLMIGDDPDVDIACAANMGIDQVLYNTTGKQKIVKPTYEIKQLIDLKEIL
ncbi:MAG: YjjG family noncanonical pyrimidine nucleotidase [Marinilabiliales bacterium]